MKISVVTVCYNAAETVGHTLRSVHEQTYQNIEHIIVDGGSKDSTLSVVAAEAIANHKLVSETDKGIYDAMNKGIALCTGDIIGFINADDFYPSPDVLSKVTKVFEKNDTDCCYGDLFYVQQNDVSRVTRYWKSCAFKPNLFEKGWCPPHPTFFVRRSVYDRLGRFNLNYKIAADVELMSRFLVAGGISSFYIPEVLVHMRMGGTTNRSLSNIIRQNLEIRRALLENGLRFSWIQFILSKLMSRSLQFVRRPK